MSILQHIIKSLIVEDQNQAKKIAADDSNNFSASDLLTLKGQLDKSLFNKTLGWIAKNWDDVPHDEIAGMVTYYFKNNKNKLINLLPTLESYKTPEEFIVSVRRAKASEKFSHRDSKVKSKDAYNTIWESDDKKIEVVIPQTKTASINKGRGSKWCTAFDDNDTSEYTSHMFCQYVLNTRGLMVYIINNNLSTDNIMHKTAVRLEENHNGKIDIMEIRDMENNTDYHGTVGFGWDDTYAMYLKQWNIPLDEIFSSIHVEVYNMDGERNLYKYQSKFIDAVESADYNTIHTILDTGYTPDGSALNAAVEVEDKKMLSFLLQFKTVKPNNSTLNAIMDTVDTMEEVHEYIKMIPYKVPIKYAKYERNIILNDDKYEFLMSNNVRPDEIALNSSIDANKLDKYHMFINMGVEPTGTTLEKIVVSISTGRISDEDEDEANKILHDILDSGVEITLTTINLSIPRVHSNRDLTKTLIMHESFKSALSSDSSVAKHSLRAYIRAMGFSERNSVEFPEFSNSDIIVIKYIIDVSDGECISKQGIGVRNSEYLIESSIYNDMKILDIYIKGKYPIHNDNFAILNKDNTTEFVNKLIDVYLGSGGDQHAPILLYLAEYNPIRLHSMAYAIENGLYIKRQQYVDKVIQKLIRNDYNHNKDDIITAKNIIKKIHEHHPLSPDQMMINIHNAIAHDNLPLLSVLGDPTTGGRDIANERYSVRLLISLYEKSVIDGDTDILQNGITGYDLHVQNDNYDVISSIIKMYKDYTENALSSLDVLVDNGFDPTIPLKHIYPSDIGNEIVTYLENKKRTKS